MKVKVLYYELKEKEFREKKTLTKFLNKKLPSEILRVIDYKKGGLGHPLELQDFIKRNRSQ